MKKIISLLLSLVLVLSLAIPALAAEQSNDNTLSEIPALTQQQKELLNKWVAMMILQKNFQLKREQKRLLARVITLY